MRRRTIIVLVAIWLGTAEAFVNSTETPSRSPEAEQFIFRATNLERIKNSLAPLIWDQKLADIAYAHSADMIVRDFFDHVTPTGESPTERIHRQHRQFIGNTGENLSVVVGAPPLRPELISEQAVSGWLKSPPHRVNLLDPTFTHIGIGVAVDGVEAKITQNFMQVRGILQDPLPERLRRGEALSLKVVSFPTGSPKANGYILGPIGSQSEQKNPTVWPFSVKRPFVAPGNYSLQFCFPAPESRFFQVFPGPHIEFVK